MPGAIFALWKAIPSGFMLLRSEERRVGKECRSRRDWSSDVCSSDLRAVSASADKTLKLWDLDSGRELRTLEGHSLRVHAVAVTPDGHHAVSASAGKTRDGGGVAVGA